jgi:proline racemase
MGFKRLVSTIDAHVEGAPLRFVTGGILDIPGKTMAEKQDFMKQNLDYLRSALVNEPRGHKDMLSFVLTSPVTDEAAFGAIIINPLGYVTMCGHGSIGVSTIAVETGMVEVREPVTELVIDTVAGPIHARVNVAEGRGTSSTIRNVPSFLWKSALVKVPDLGELPVDIAYGGNFYAIVDNKHLSIELSFVGVKRSESLLEQILNSVNEQVEIYHPEIRNVPELKKVIAVIINDEPLNPKANMRNILISGSGTKVQHIDRSPCGTGTSAKMAALYAKGELSLEETFVSESMLGTLYCGKLVKEISVDNIKAVVPEITGSAFITGMHTFVMDEDDPFKAGFIL